MAGQETKLDSDTGSPSLQGIIKKFVYGAVMAVLKAIPTTLIAIVVGAVVGGFLGLPFGPAAPLFAIVGAVVLGLPVAVWEYMIQKKENSAWNFIE